MNSLRSGLRGKEGMACNPATEGYLACVHLQSLAWAYGVEQHWLPMLNSVYLTAYGITGTHDGSILVQFHFCQWNSQHLTVGEVSGVFYFRYWWMSVQGTANSGSVFGWTGTFHQSVFRLWVFLLNNLPELQQWKSLEVQEGQFLFSYCIWLWKGATWLDWFCPIAYIDACTTSWNYFLS